MNALYQTLTSGPVEYTLFLMSYCLFSFITVVFLSMLFRTLIATYFYSKGIYEKAKLDAEIEYLKKSSEILKDGSYPHTPNS